MKKIVLVLTVALLGSIVMNAQPPRRPDMNPEQMVEKRVEHLDKALSLTEEQKAAIADIYTQEMVNMAKDKPAKKERGEMPDEATMKARREQMKASHEATEAKIEAVLTPEQAVKYAELKQHEGKRHRGHHDGKRDGMDRGPKKAGCCDANCDCNGKKAQ